MKRFLAPILRRNPAFSRLGLTVLLVAGAFGVFVSVSAATARDQRRAAERVAAAHVGLLSAISAIPVAEQDPPVDNAAVAVLRAAAISASGLALVPGED